MIKFLPAAPVAFVWVHVRPGESITSRGLWDVLGAVEAASLHSIQRWDWCFLHAVRHMDPWPALDRIPLQR